MINEVKQLLMSIKGETSCLLADFTNGLTKTDIVALSHLFEIVDNLLLGNLQRDDYSEEDIILSRMYEVYAMLCYSATPCLSTIKSLLNKITEIL